MVNTTQFYKTKVALAVVLSLGLAACGDSEGDAGSTATTTSSTDATQNTTGNQNELSMTVQGVVVDTNGNPLAGVAVYLGSLETVTNAGGQYTFSGVGATNVNGVNNEGDESDDDVTQSLVVTIAGTAEHLGALVTVTPQAQVNNTGGQGNDDGTDGGNSNTTIQTFVSGLTAQAGTAVLPMLNAGAYGYIRDCATGAALVDTADLISLDFLSRTADGDIDPVTGLPTGNNNGVQLTNSENSATISSDAAGEFSLTGLAANSTYTISAKQGWSITSGTGELDEGDTFTTDSEGSSQFLNTIEVCPVDFTPVDLSKAPFIKSIDGQIGTSTVGLTGTDSLTTAAAVVDAQYAALNQGVVNDFVINFSEEMASTFDLAEARVKVIAPGTTTSATVSDATVTLSADGKSATVTFVTDLAEGTKVDVWFPHWTALDANDDMFLVDNNSIIFDTIELALTGQDKAVYSHAYFCTFAKPTDVASVTLAPQVFDADTTEDGASADLAGYSTAFQDNVDGGPAITQLNDGDALSGSRLTDLAVARGATTVTVDQDYAVVEFDGTGAASLIWKHDGTTVDPGTTVGYTIVGTGANTTLHVTPAAHNDVISVTPVNGFGDVISSGTMSVTLVDAIAPTTVLQESYNITAVIANPNEAPREGQDVVDGATANASFGNGGEISAPGTTATAAGEPIIHIQPRHLAGQTAGADDRNNELNSLTADMANRLTSGEVTALGGTDDALKAISVTTYTTGAFETPIYDAKAYANWAAIPAKIGVAFNENVTLTTTPPAFDGATTLSGYAALNDVAVNVDGQPSVVDLVTFDTPSVVSLSLDAGEDLGFVGSVTDSRGNVSTANAQVFVQDTFPPMMTAAIWNGETLALTFNEPPVFTTGANITVLDPSDTDNFETIGVSATNAVIAGNVMTITLDGPQNVAAAALFVSGANNEFAYDDDNSTTNNLPEGEQHALIDWDNIADATGNEWSEFNPMLSVSNRGMESAPANTDVRRWEVVAPRFLAVDAVGVFTYTVATSSYLDSQAPGAPDGDDDGSVTYTISFTHPIRVDSTLNAFSTVLNAHPSYDTDVKRDGAISVNTADANGVTLMNGLFSVDIANDGADAFVSNATGVSATQVHGAFNLSADHKVITLTVEGVADGAGSILFGTTTFGFKTTTTSAITGSLTSSGNFNWQDNN